VNLVHSKGRTLKEARPIPKYSVKRYSWNEDNDIMGLKMMKPKHREKWRFYDKQKWDAQMLGRNRNPCWVEDHQKRETQKYGRKD
jgi:hypothetical protein